MKKIIAISTLLTVSSFALAQGFSDPNDARTQQAENPAPAVQNEINKAEMPKMPPHPMMEMHGKGKFHAMPQGKHFDKQGKNRDFKPPFFDESQAVKSVKDIQAAKDKAFVMIEGKIIKQVGKKDYLFQDATGEVEIEVSRKAWGGQTITPNDKIEIRGLVDKEWDKTEIEVKQIIKK